MRKFTLKKDGKYFTRQGYNQGFLAHGIAACYSYDETQIKAVQAQFGGEIVEIVYTPGKAGQLGQYSESTVVLN